MLQWIKRVLHKADDEGPRTPGQEAAASAIRRIEDAVAASDRRGPEVSRIAETLRGLQRQNHFREAIEASFRGGGN